MYIKYIKLINSKLRILPGKSHGQRSLVGCSPWSHKESDTTSNLAAAAAVQYLEKEKNNFNQTKLTKYR